MASVRDPRDPREPKSPPIGQQLDHLASSMDVMIRTLSARLGEVVRTQQDANAHLAVMSRNLQDLAVMGGGVGGVVPAGAAASSVSVHQRMVSEMQADAARRNNAPYTAGVEWTVNGAAGNLAGQTRQGIRSGVAGWLSGRAGYLADQYELHQGEHLDPEGNVIGTNDGYFMDEHGRYRNSAGRYASAANAVTTVMTGEERGHLGARLATANTMSRMGQAWSETGRVGRAVMAGLPQGALKTAGVAGAVIAAGKEGWEWVQGQYEANRRFQEVYGGSNMDQIGERFDRFKNHWRGYFSLLGADNYDKLFDSGMNMGLRGSDRDRYIDVGADIMGTGANAQQTTGIMNMSIQAGLGLGGLAQAIRDVNEAAREAGINAGRAREIFMKNYEASSDIMFGSQQAKSYATLVTTGQIAQARPYQGINLNGVADNTQVTALRASQLGMTYSQLEIAQKDSAVGTQLSIESTIKDAIEKQTPESGGVPFKQAVQEYMDQLKASGTQYYPKWHQVALGEYVTSRGWPSYLLQRLLAVYGVQVDAPLAAGYIANLYTEFSPGQMGARTEAERSQDLSVKTDAAYYTKGQGIVDLKSNSLPVSDDVARSDLWKVYTDSMQKGANVTLPSGNKAPSVTQYPVIEELVANTSAYGIDKKKTKVMVETKDGPKVVTMEEAIREFGDQIQNGTARFVEGVNEGYMDKTVADVLGFQADSTGVTVTSNTKSIDWGETDEDFLKRRAEEEKAKSGSTNSGTQQNVTITLTPEARRLLTVVDQRYLDTSTTSGGG